MLSREDIVSWFALDSSVSEKIGFELEMWVLDKESGNQLPYSSESGSGERGMRELLLMLYHECLGREGWTILEEESVLVGLNHSDHGSLTLEPGCALEYSGPSLPSCTAALNEFRIVIDKIKPIIHSFGGALILLGNAPFGFNGRENWLPKSRVKVQGDYFTNKADGHSGLMVMSQICSLQVCLDINTQDFSDKLRVSTILAPIMAALSANSCIDHGTPDKFAARRQLVWLESDTLRTGTPPTLFSEKEHHYKLDEYIEWLLDMPMMFYIRGGCYRELPRRPFRAWLSTPLPDGSAPTIADWKTHLSSVFPDVRVRQYLEFRVMDAPHPSLLAPLITLFTSLMYDPAAREYILNYVPHCLPDDRARLFKEIALKGMYATLNNQALIEMIFPLLEQGRQALTRRIEKGLESDLLLQQFENFVRLLEEAQHHRNNLCHLPDCQQGETLKVHDVLKFCAL